MRPIDLASLLSFFDVEPREPTGWSPVSLVRTVDECDYRGMRYRVAPVPCGPVPLPPKPRKGRKAGKPLAPPKPPPDYVRGYRVLCETAPHWVTPERLGRCTYAGVWATIGISRAGRPYSITITFGGHLIVWMDDEWYPTISAANRLWAPNEADLLDPALLDLIGWHVHSAHGVCKFWPDSEPRPAFIDV